MWISAGIAVLGVVLLLSMLLIGELFGGDHEISHDIGAGHDVDAGGPSIFSTRIIAAFRTAFGVGGEGNELAVVGIDANEVWGLGAAGHNGAW